MSKEIATLPADYADWLSTLKQFAQECPDFRIGQQSAAQLPSCLAHSTRSMSHE